MTDFKFWFDIGCARNDHFLFDFYKKIQHGLKMTSRFDPPGIGGCLLDLIRNALKY